MKQYRKIIMRKKWDIASPSTSDKTLVATCDDFKTVSTEGKAWANVIPAAVDLKPVWGRSGGYTESKTVRLLLSVHLNCPNPGQWICVVMNSKDVRSGGRNIILDWAEFITWHVSIRDAGFSELIQAAENSSNCWLWFNVFYAELSWDNRNSLVLYETVILSPVWPHAPFL